MKKYQRFLSENFQFLEVKFSIYLNRRVFVMADSAILRGFVHASHLSLSFFLFVKHDFLYLIAQSPYYANT